MHRVTLPDGRRVKDNWIKWARTLAYLLMGASGVLLLLSPLHTLVYGVLSTVMAWFLVVGGACSFIGSLTERWWGEYVGLPLLSSSFAVFGVVTLRGSYSEAPYISTADLFLLVAVGLALMTRWREVQRMFAVAMHIARRDRESRED